VDHIGILKRAFAIARRYRALWVFGILLALFGGAGTSGGNSRVTMPGGRGSDAWPPGFMAGRIDPGTIIGIAAVCGVIVLLLVVISAIAGYVSRTALYRMVDSLEETGECPSWREGFRLGWSRRAWRLLGIDLLIAIPFTLGVILLLSVAASPLLLLLLENNAARAVGIVMTIGFGVIAIGVIIVAGVAVNVAKKFMHRQAALDGQRASESIRIGYQMVRQNLKDSLIMWLLMVASGFAWGVVMIPVFIVVLLLAGVIGVLPGFLIWKGTELLWLALLVGVPLFLVIMVPPLVFLQGLYSVFESSSWTLTYREFRSRWVSGVAEADLLVPKEIVAPSEN